MVLDRSFYNRSSLEVAPELLNKVLFANGLSGRIVEVEAYGGADDPASHAYRGQTKRNSSMFLEGGTLYVYFIYGMHNCINCVCLPAGIASAVLIRALEPVEVAKTMINASDSARIDQVPGLDSKSMSRPAKLSKVHGLDLRSMSGPGKLAKVLGIDRQYDGMDLTNSDKITVFYDGVDPPRTPGNGPRVGISRAQDLPWRWWVEKS